MAGSVTKSHNESDHCDASTLSSSTSNLDRPSSSMQRANRPPDLDLSTTQSLLHNTMTERFRIPKHASTPEKFLTNQMQDVSLSIKPVGEQNIFFNCGIEFEAVCPLLQNILVRTLVIIQNQSGNRMIRFQIWCHLYPPVARYHTRVKNRLG